MLRRLWNNTTLIVLFTYYVIAIAVRRMMGSRDNKYYIGEDLPPQEDLPFKVEDLNNMIQDFLNKNTSSPTHLFVSLDIMKSLLYSMHHRSQRVSFTSDFSVNRLTYMYSFSTSVVIEPVMENKNFMLLGYEDAYNRYLIEKHILGVED